MIKKGLHSSNGDSFYLKKVCFNKHKISMRSIFKTIIIFGVLLFLSACKKEKMVLAPQWDAAHQFYLNNITTAIAYLDTLETLGADHIKAKEIFKEARVAFKRAEPFAAYLNPEAGHRANGPALPVFRDDSESFVAPIGLQKIEESIYEGNVDQSEFTREVDITKGLLTVLKKDIIKRKLSPKRFFVGTHQQLFRIISLAITGFDTPVSKLGLQEVIVSLKALKKVYTLTIQGLIKEKNSKLDSDFNTHIEKAITFIKNNPDFDSFDRYTFTRDYMNPITKDWVAIRKASDLWDGKNIFPFNFDAPTFFEQDAWNITYFTPPINRNASKKQIALGKKLFFDPKLSANGKMACVTCHIPSKGYTDGFKVSMDNNGGQQIRNTPTLLNSVFQQSFFWDGRSQTLEDQITSVFKNKQEFNTNVHQFSNTILTDTLYKPLLIEVFGKVPSKNTEIIKAISSYIATLNGFNSKFDKNIRGEENTFTDEEKLGFNLFTGKALCATCHFMPLSNGTVPPFFSETEKEVIGVPLSEDNKELDTDLGFYWRHKKDIHKGMFKTPTVRNVALTAPYMHNGVYKTLEEVVNFYNLGGGGGLGFDLEHQTLPFDELNLTKEEQKAIVAFMHTLTDNSVANY